MQQSCLPEKPELTRFTIGNTFRQLIDSLVANYRFEFVERADDRVDRHRSASPVEADETSGSVQAAKAEAQGRPVDGTRLFERHEPRPRRYRWWLNVGFVVQTG